MKTKRMTFEQWAMTQDGNPGLREYEKYCDDVEKTNSEQETKKMKALAFEELCTRFLKACVQNDQSPVQKMAELLRFEKENAAFMKTKFTPTGGWTLCFDVRCMKLDPKRQFIPMLQYDHNQVPSKDIIDLCLRTSQNYFIALEQLFKRICQAKPGTIAEASILPIIIE